MTKRCIAVLLCLVLVCCSVPTALAAAEIAPSTGDVNADGTVNMKDVLGLRRFLAGLDTGVAGNGDVNGDGDVNMKDVLMLRRYLAGLEATLPAATETLSTSAGTLPTGETTAGTSASVTEKPSRTTKPKTTWATKYPIDHNAPRINFIDNTAATLGVWWWHADDTYNEALCARYLTLLEENQVTEIYFYCAHLLTSEQNRAKVHTFVQEAMKRGMRVAVLFDNQNVVKAGDTSFTNAVSRVLTYKEEYPQDDVYGLHCDIEPQAPDRVNGDTWSAWTQGYVTNFIPQIAAARKQGVWVELDIGCGWWVNGFDRAYEGSEMHEYDGTTMDLFDVIANNVDCMCMMTYRDTAPAILDMADAGRRAADKAGCKIVYGVETGDDGEGAHVDFYADSKEIMYTELSKLCLKLESEPPVGGYGFAIHYMRMWDALRDTLE